MKPLVTKRNNFFPFLLLFIQPIFMASNIIVARGGVEYVPQVLFDQLSDGGHLVCVFRPPGLDVGEATIWHKRNNHVTPKALFTAQVPVLDEFKLKPKFAF